MKPLIGILIAVYLLQIPFEALNPSGPNNSLAPLDESQILVVNLIPQTQSSEEGQDSEPFLALTKDQKLLIAAVYYGQTVFSKNQKQPLFMSEDGGRTWKLISISPAVGQLGGQTYCFSDGTSLYGAIASRNQSLSVVHSDDPRNQPLQTISALNQQSLTDQPFVQVRSFPPDVTTQDSPAPRIDRIYVGQNYFGPELTQGRTASVRVSTDGGKKFRLLGVEARATAGQDGPAVLPAIASDGTVYVAFVHWQSKQGEDAFKGRVVVTRDDAGVTGAKPFLSLIDPSDGLPGRFVTQEEQEFPFGYQLGKQKVKSSLSLAVDPSDSAIVYICWGAYDPAKKTYDLHLRKSTDRGQNWSEDLLTIPSATNPAIAISKSGTIGLLYQQLQNAGKKKEKEESEETWETHFRRSEYGTSDWADIPLSAVPTSADPDFSYDPYLGDKLHLISIEDHFFGVFSAPNKPVPKHFPQGVIFQRNYSGEKLLSIENREIKTSIDPFFFRIAANSRKLSAASTTPAANVDDRRESAVSAFSLRNLPPAILLLISGGLLALILYLLKTGPKKVEEKVDRVIQQRVSGPTLTNYKGFFRICFVNKDGNALDQIRPSTKCDVVVTFEPNQRDSLWEAEINLQGGENARHAVFTVAVDTDDFEVSPDHKSVSVPMNERVNLRFELKAPPTAGTYSLFVQAFQKNLLVQVIPATVTVGESQLSLI